VGEPDAKAALEKSPRHGEWADVAGPGGQKIRTWVVYPERKDKAPVVLVIMEVYGLSDWLRALADQLAADGFIAVAPDLISGRGPGGGGTEAVGGSRDDVVKLVRELSAEDAAKRLDAVRAWALKLPAANGRSASLGFCWGGARSFEYAASQPGIDAAVVYYGTSPSEALFDRVKAPVLGLYGGDDARVNATIEPAKVELAKRKRTYEVLVFDGAGHGFLRQQDARDGANKKAAEAAWPLTLAFLRAHTGETK
jgi:carboxymethylenebutenolidase